MKSTGWSIEPRGSRKNLIVADESERVWDLAAAATRRSNSSLSADFLDIEFFHDLSRDGVYSVSANTSGTGAADVDAIKFQNVRGERDRTDDADRSDRRADNQDHLTAVDHVDLNRQFG
jgi:hypothetical protein